ncbi:hypothetical protein HKCCE3408_11495 [Rhodobacterales bacterium HKCCE3408]|nr:hypothetical protein [Rhodobacterales bacterium HKCCE3408]
MRKAVLVSPLAATFAASRAEAHAFEIGADYYSQFLEGASVVFTYPSLLLPTLALGILLSLWRLDGLLRVWPLFLIGLAAGLVLGAFVGPAVSTVLTAVGVVTAALAAVLGRHVWAEAAVLALATGLLVTSVSLEGHGLFELGVFIYLGILFAANIALAWSAAMVRLALEQIDQPWVRIGGRVAASWIGAILVLMLAFAIANP